MRVTFNFKRVPNRLDPVPADSVASRQVASTRIGLRRALDRYVLKLYRKELISGPGS